MRRVPEFVFADEVKFQVFKAKVKPALLLVLVEN